LRAQQTRRAGPVRNHQSVDRDQPAEKRRSGPARAGGSTPTHQLHADLHQRCAEQCIGRIKRGTVDQGKLEAQLTVDLQKLAGWQDLTLYANAFQIHNTGRIRRDYVGGRNTIAAIEASATTRLSELWLERKILDGAGSIRVGQLAADSEFFYSDLSVMFLQSDWPTIGAVNLPGGGPAYPLSTPARG